jgi:hypothetical protein
MTDSQGLPAGAIDLHVHSSPSIFPRLLDDHEVVAQAAAANMRAVVLKAHEGSTVARAGLAETPEVTVRGGVVLNHYVGGLNPAAVELALALGAGRACLVWMPTVHARNHLEYYGAAGYREQQSRLEAGSVEPLTVLDGRGRLTQDALAVLEVLASQPQAVLSSGHLGARDTAVLFREARQLGVERLLVTHPELPLTGFSLDFQLEMADLGAIIERCYLPHLERWGGQPAEVTAHEIRRLGPERCVLSPDLGQADSPPPAAGLAAFCSLLANQGLGEADIMLMVVRNPGALLSLDRR